jgi:hypothetical protein
VLLKLNSQFFVLQTATGQKRRRMVSQEPNQTGLERVPAGGTAQTTHRDRHQDPGPIWQWPRSGVRRGVRPRVLETGNAHVAEMEKPQQKRGEFFLS